MKRVTRILVGMIVAWCIAVFFYGMFSFPDSPFRPCGADAGYCGKTGRPHTQADYDAWKKWEKVILISWPFGIAAGMFVMWQRRKSSLVTAGKI